jgi:hypothetical protein
MESNPSLHVAATATKLSQPFSKKVSGLFATGRVSLTYLTETMVHIYIPQPRGDLAVEVIGLGLTWLCSYPLWVALSSFLDYIIAEG